MKKLTYTLLSISQLSKRIGLSKSTIYRKLNPDNKQYDASFPSPVRMGVNTVRWIDTEIDEWLRKVIFEQRKDAA